MEQQQSMLDDTDELPPEIITKEKLKKSLDLDWDKKTQLQKAHAVLDYLNRLTGKRFSTINPSGKNTAHTKLVIDRIKDGYKKDDFHKVVAGQHKQWSNDDKMRKYLRPSTLFVKKNFENYLDANQVSGNNQNGYVAEAPDLMETLIELITEWKYNRQTWGYNMPPLPEDAANWWKDVMQPDPKANECAHQQNGHWVFPYLDRLVSTLKAYVLLPLTDQKIIFGCAEDGVHWRGDNLDFFFHNERSIYNETMRMRELGKDEYKKSAKQIFSQAMGKMSV